jgi:predicted HTH transcriptional regulator
MSTTANTDDLCSRIETLIQDHIAASQQAATAAIQRAFAATPQKVPLNQRRGKRAPVTYRSKEMLLQLQDRIYTQLSASPGMGAADLSAQLGVSAKDMHRPIAKLKEAGLVRSVGQRSETRYFPVCADTLTPS